MLISAAAAAAAGGQKNRRHDTAYAGAMAAGLDGGSTPVGAVALVLEPHDYAAAAAGAPLARVASSTLPCFSWTGSPPQVASWCRLVLR